MSIQLELFNATGTIRSKETRHQLGSKNLRSCTLCRAVMLLRQKGMQVYVGDTVPSDGCMIPSKRRRSFVCMKQSQEDPVQHNSGKRHRMANRRKTV